MSTEALGDALVAAQDHIRIAMEELASVRQDIADLQEALQRTKSELDALRSATAPKREAAGLWHRDGKMPRWAAGTVLRVRWADLEPEPGVFAWDALDARISIAAAAGFSVRLRPLLGVHAPPWVGEQVGTVPYVEPQSDRTYELPRLWSPDYQRLAARFYRALAEYYDIDPRVHTVFAAGAMTVYAEPMIRGLPRNASALTDAGYTVAEDLALQEAQLYWMLPWQRTLVGLAYNPLQTPDGPDVAATLALMRLHLALFGSRAVVQNNSLRSRWIVEGFPPSYDALYQDGLLAAAAGGHQVGVQLAAASRVGDEEACIRWCADHGIRVVEVSETLTTLRYLELSALFSGG